jgi:hypothetical protein
MICFPLAKWRSNLCFAAAVAAILSSVSDATAQGEQLRPREGYKLVRIVEDPGPDQKTTRPATSRQSRVRTAKDFEEEATEPKGALLPDEGGLDQLERQNQLQAQAAAEAQVRYQFNVPGASVVEAARRAGYHFSPKGGKSLPGGAGMAAYQMVVHPDAPTSLVKGHQMTQFQPSRFWVVEHMTNQFHMFTDANGRPKVLKEGWSVQEVVLQGNQGEKGWRWLTRPKAGAKSLSFSVELTAAHGTDTIVQVVGARLIGPPGVRDWKEAFQTESKPASSEKSRRTGVRATGL